MIRDWLDRADAWLERHWVIAGVITVIVLILAAIAFGRPGPG